MHYARIPQPKGFLSVRAHPDDEHYQCRVLGSFRSGKMHGRCKMHIVEGSLIYKLQFFRCYTSHLNCAVKASLL